MRESAAPNSEAVPPEIPSNLPPSDSRRWPVIQKNAGRSAFVGIALVGVVFVVMHSLALGYDLNAGRLLAALGVASCVCASLFCLLGESAIEDCVKTILIGVTGCMFAWWFPLPWCLLPGAGAIVGSIVNRTVRATLGRYF